MDTGPALTTAEVMRLLNVKDPDTVYALVRSGRLRAVRLGRQYRFDPSAVAEFVRGGPATLPVADVKRRQNPRRGVLPPCPRYFRRRSEEGLPPLGNAIPRK